MEHLERKWTPWRMAYVSGVDAARERGEACFLCAKPAEPPEQDAENLILYRGERVYVLLNLYPYNTGHLMVAPYAHVGRLPDLDPQVRDDLFALVQESVRILEEVYRPDGFNVGLNLGRAAGAGVPDHLHVHVVPRWIGDTNFMPLLGGVKLLPELLEQTWQRLRPAFAALEG